MGLTTLAERRIRGDLIETFKIINSLVDYGKGIFKLSQSGKNIIAEKSFSASKNIEKLRMSFLPGRIKDYWNSLPLFVKLSKDVNDFKCNLDIHKNKCTTICKNNFWNVSDLVLERIEGSSYMINKEKHLMYLKENPYLAKKRGINIFNA